MKNTELVKGYLMAASFANRLAGGGYWAMCMARLAYKMTEELNEQDFRPPVGDGSPDDAFVHCGTAAFEIICNLYMKNMAMHVTVKKANPPRTYNRQGEQIPFDLWERLFEDDTYKRVAKWHNDCGGDVHVSTIWTGMDPRGGNEIFETVLIKECDKHYHMGHSIRTSTEAEAIACHNAMVAAVRGGFI